MNKTIVYCTAAVVFQENRILDENIAKNYPGALWLTELSQVAREHGMSVLTGDVAITKIQNESLQPSEILIIQEENCTIGFELIKMGAKPFLLVCGESPLYARNFYAHLPEISALFKNRLLFRGVFSNTSKGGINHILHFPSFSQGYKGVTVEWSDRGFMVMVAANKYWKPERTMLRGVIARFRDILMGRKSYISEETKSLQLHDRRFEIIEYFGLRKDLDLFGSGWADISNLPKSWRHRLKPIITTLNPTVCADKHAIIRRYKFAICFENMSYLGYITEKIIDCLRAGVIPIYLGAPDVGDFVPKAAFIDLREFKNLDALHHHLTSMTEDIAESQIAAGQNFLSSEIGAQYSYEGIAANVFKMIKSYE